MAVFVPDRLEHRCEWRYPYPGSNQHNSFITLPLSKLLNSFIPASKVDVIAEKLCIIPLLHLSLQRLQEVSKPFKGMSVPAKPVKIDLEERRENCQGTQYLGF